MGLHEGVELREAGLAQRGSHGAQVVVGIGTEGLRGSEGNTRVAIGERDDERRSQRGRGRARHERDRRERQRGIWIPERVTQVVSKLVRIDRVLECGRVISDN